MSREPLMLSDTAMVLLRRYFELYERTLDVYRQIGHGLTSPMTKDELQEYREWHQLHNVSRRMGEMQRDLLEEFCLLWSFPDLPPIQQLDWHFVLEGDLLAFFVDLVYRSPEQRIFFSPLGEIASNFVGLLMRDYKNALAERAQTKTTP